MLRVKDPQASLDFYTRILGFTLLDRLDFSEMKFTLYFLGYYPGEEVPDDPQERVGETARDDAVYICSRNG
jgi:lactoylglutathione lyase